MEEHVSTDAEAPRELAVPDAPEAEGRDDERGVDRQQPAIRAGRDGADDADGAAERPGGDAAPDERVGDVGQQQPLACDRGGGGDAPAAVADIVQPGDRAYCLIEVRETPDGRVHARVRRLLTTKVYKRGLVERLAKYEAKATTADPAVLLALRPSGSALGAWHARTGRAVPSKVRSKVRRIARELLPHLFGGGGRRTSRRRSSRRAARRRTSRVAR